MYPWFMEYGFHFTVNQHNVNKKFCSTGLLLKIALFFKYSNICSLASKFKLFYENKVLVTQFKRYSLLRIYLLCHRSFIEFKFCCKIYTLGSNW